MRAVCVCVCVGMCGGGGEGPSDRKRSQKMFEKNNAFKWSAYKLCLMYYTRHLNTGPIHTSICPVWLGCPVFKWHSNNGPFGIQPFFDHSNTELV